MNTKTKAVEDFRNLAKGFKAVIALADELEKVGNLEHAENELRAQIDAHQKDLGNIKSKAANEQARLDKLVIDTEASANALAAKILDQAKVDAEKVLADAKSSANSIVADATAKNAELLAVNSDLAAAGEQLDNENTAKAIEIKSLDARIAKAKAQIEKMLGG